MRTLRFILEKEFRQIFRNPTILRIMFLLPAIQLIILPMAADYEVKNVHVAIVDQDNSTYSRRLISMIDGSPYFHLQGISHSFNTALDAVEDDLADLVLQIPDGFERALVRDNEANLFMAVNAINGVKANLGSAYLNQSIRNFNSDIRTEWIQFPRYFPEPRIEVVPSIWFNPHLSYPLFMVPGILTLLLTMVGGFLAALNIVVEKEVGTIEQLNVTPLKKSQVILGKLIPFWVLGYVVLTVGMLISYIVYGIVPVGSLSVIYAFAGVFMLAVLGFGLLISTMVETQQQAMLVGFFFMLIFILMSGLYTPIESMPEWAQVVTRFNPVTYFVSVMRMVVIKGSGFADVAQQFGAMAILAVALNSVAIWNYRKRG